MATNRSRAPEGRKSSGHPAPPDVWKTYKDAGDGGPVATQTTGTRLRRATLGRQRPLTGRLRYKLVVSLRYVVMWLSDVRVFTDSCRTTAAAVMSMPVGA